MSDVAVLTGATSGLGRWVARGLAEAGRRVVVVARDKARGQALLDWLAAEVPAARTEMHLADLALLSEARRVGRDILAAHPRIGLLINNAGVFTARRTITAEGRETVLATNHLSPYVLTETLLPGLRAASPARVVNVGSSSSDRASIRPDALELDAGSWGMLRAYAGSKLALMMSTFARAERLEGSGVVVNVVHPGLVATDIVREGGLVGFGWRLLRPFSRTEEQGARTPLFVAVAPEWASVSGTYAKNRARARPNRLALDRALVARVDAATLALIGRTLGPDWAAA